MTTPTRPRRSFGRAALAGLLCAAAVVSAVAQAVAAAPPHRPPRAEAGPAAPPPANAGFDYQIGGDYQPPAGVTVVSRDWFAGKPLPGGYSICYVNAYQTQDDEPDVDRPDERSNWPAALVLTGLGDDPNWGGEYLIDISTAEARRAAAAWVAPMVEACAAKGFAAVEFDNLDSWTRFDGTPLEGEVPFGPEEAVAYAALLVEQAHRLGLAAGQKNTVELSAEQARGTAGFDFAVAEECGQFKECQGYRDLYQDNVIVIEYGQKGFRRACKEFGDRLSIVLRDRDVRPAGAAGHVFDAC